MPANSVFDAATLLHEPVLDNYGDIQLIFTISRQGTLSNEHPVPLLDSLPSNSN